MPGSLPRTTSVRKRIRHLTTLACVLACAAGLLALLSGHVAHGALLMLAGLVLVPGSIWGRRHKRQPLDAGLLTPEGVPAARRWRKAA